MLPPARALEALEAVKTVSNLQGQDAALTPTPMPAPRLLRLATSASRAATPALSLDALKPLPLFERLVERETGAAPDPDLLQAFGELLTSLQR